MNGQFRAICFRVADAGRVRLFHDGLGHVVKQQSSRAVAFGHGCVARSRPVGLRGRVPRSVLAADSTHAPDGAGRDDRIKWHLGIRSCSDVV